MPAVERVGVRIVLGEAGVGLGVALAAGAHDVGLGEVGTGVGSGQDVVVAVAVVAGGDFRGDVWPAQRHSFAVVGFAVMGQAVLVALAATLVADGFEVVVLGVLDLMGGVAVGADRAARVAFGHKLAVDALLVGLLDAEVAFAAGLGDVRAVDRGVAINGGLDVVDAVAVIAGGRDDQAHLEQGAAVDAVHVLGGGLGILDLVGLGQARIAVALGTRRREIHLEDRRGGVGDWQHGVGAVAVAARGGAGRAHGVAYAVDAGRIIPGCLLVAWLRVMAADAVRRFGRDVVIGMLRRDVYVTVDAGVGSCGRTPSAWPRPRRGRLPCRRRWWW